MWILELIKMRELVQDFIDGGTKYKDREKEVNINIKIYIFNFPIKYSFSSFPHKFIKVKMIIL